MCRLISQRWQYSKKYLIGYKKKAWRSDQPLVPRLEALALPCSVERATQSPRRCLYTTLILIAPMFPKQRYTMRQGCQ